MDPYESLTRNIIRSEMFDRNQVLNHKKHVNKNIKIQLHLHVKSNESFLKAPLLELYLARIENIPEFVIKFSTG